MRFWTRTPEGVRRTRYYWVATAVLSLGAILSGISAWHGQKLAIVSLVLFQVALAVLLHLQRNTVWDTLDHMRDMNEEYALELDFSKVLIKDHLEVLGRLYALDPTAAEVYQDRFREATLKRWPGFLEERAKHAGMN